MCGRFAIAATQKEFAEEFGVEPEPPPVARYNVAPSQPLLLLRAGGAKGREAAFAQWGLIPGWVKDLAAAPKPINARAETAAEKPTFRSGMKYRRCLIPASGFFEWKTEAGGKQPWFIRVKGRPLFAMAGVWELWNGPDGEQIETCAILTTAANELMARLHQRMPVIVGRDDYDRWLDSRVQKPADVADLMGAFPSELMEAWPVTKAVGNPRYDAPDCVEPLAPVSRLTKGSDS